MIAVPVRYSSGFCSSSDWRLLRLTLAPTALSVFRSHGASEHPRIHVHSASCCQRRTPGELRRAETHRGSDESVNRSVAHSATFHAFSNSALVHATKPASRGQPEPLNGHSTLSRSYLPYG